MKEPLDELLDWLQDFDDKPFSCNHRNVIEKIWQLKSRPQQCNIANVICRFNTSDKRMVKVVSSDDVFEGEVTKMEWDVDHWIYFVGGEWYCQSEINGI